MPNSLQEKLDTFKYAPSPQRPGIILPSAFIARTTKSVGLIPADVDVVAERNMWGDFQLTWYDTNGREIDQKSPKAFNALAIDDVYEAQAKSLLESLTNDEVYEEWERRNALLRGIQHSTADVAVGGELVHSSGSVIQGSVADVAREAQNAS
jgi:hypothetical protein